MTKIKNLLSFYCFLRHTYIYPSLLLLTLKVSHNIVNEQIINKLDMRHHLSSLHETSGGRRPRCVSINSSAQALLSRDITATQLSLIL